MSTKISRRNFLKCTGAAAVAVGTAGMLSGCSKNGNSTVVDNVKVGDAVQNWNDLGVQLQSIFELNGTPSEEGYEYIGVRVIVTNRSKKNDFSIGATGVAEIDEMYPVPPAENIEANFAALSAATPDFVAACDGETVMCSANMSLYNSNSQSFYDSEVLPAQGSGYVFLMLKLPIGWKQVEITYMPTFVEDETLTFIMQASDVVRS